MAVINIKDIQQQDDQECLEDLSYQQVLEISGGGLKSIIVGAIKAGKVTVGAVAAAGFEAGSWIGYKVTDWILE